MVKGKTTSGFEFEVDEECLEDIDFFDLISDVTEDDPRSMKPASLYLLGAKQRAALKEHLKKVHGRAKTKDFYDEVNEIITLVPTLKNS